MAVFTLAVADVKTAYDAYLTANAVVTAAAAAITGAGAMPVAPVDIVSNSDWNDYVTALDAWLAANVTLQATYAAALSTKRVTELAIYTAMGYGSNDENQSIVLNQWIKVVGAGGGILTYTHYIAGGTFTGNRINLIVKTVLPTQAYPSF